MKRTSFLLLTLVLFFSVNAHAQKKGHAHKKAHHNHHQAHPAKKMHGSHYYRKHVKVVRPRVYPSYKVMPNGHLVYNFNGNKHYCHNGRFYRYHNNMYHFFAPPVGLRIAVLPVGYHKIHMHKQAVFYYQGTYYTSVANEYEVIDPIVGTTVPDLPEDLIEEVNINGKTYFEYNNYLYKRIAASNGDTFEVVGKLEE